MVIENYTSAASLQSDLSSGTEDLTNQDHGQKHEKSAASTCLDCTHCCAHTTVFSQIKSLPQPIIISIFAIEASQAHPQGRAFSLLRPPRTLA